MANVQIKRKLGLSVVTLFGLLVLGFNQHATHGEDWREWLDFETETMELEAVPAAYAAHVAAPRSALADKILNAKNSLDIKQFPDADAALTKLRQKLEALSTYIRPDTDNGQRWQKFLKWDRLMAEIEKPNPSRAVLIELLMDMRQNYLGLENRQFREVREAISEYVAAVRVSRDADRSMQVLDRQLEVLAEKFSGEFESSDLDRLRDIEQILDLLVDARQVPSIVAECRSAFSDPNVRVLVSREFLTSKLARPVDQPNPVNETILGTRIFGQSLVQGKVVPVLMDNPRSASLRLRMMGQFSSNNVGFNRGVKIYSIGNAEVCAAENIVLGDQGVTLADHLVSDAALDTQVTGIEHRLRIVRKLAQKQIQKKQGQANAIAQSRLKNRLQQQFHEQLVEQIAKLNQLLGKDIPELRRIDIPKPVRKSWTSSDYLALVWKQQSGNQLAADSPCPIPVPHHGLSLQIHQSAIINALDHVLGGRKLRSEELPDLIKQFSKDLPPNIMDEAKGEPWSMTFSELQPVAVKLESNTITFLIRTDRSQKSDQSLDQPATVIAKYEFVIENGALQLRRSGEVDVEFVGRADRGLRAVTLRSFLKSKFDKLFREQLLDEPLQLSKLLPADAPNMEIVSVQSDRGWLQVTLN